MKLKFVQGLIFQGLRAVALLTGIEKGILSCSWTTQAVETTRQSGIRIFESQVRAAGLRLVEPSKKNGIDFLIRSDTQTDEERTSFPRLGHD